MATVTVEQFTDPYSPWCWAAQPTLRRLRYAFDDVEWIPRMTVLLPGTEDGDASADRRSRWAEAAAATGMPVAEELWADGLPESRPACATVSFLRENRPRRVESVLRRFRVAVFAEGKRLDTPASVAAVADEVPGVEGGTVSRALEDGRAAAALEADLVRGVEVAESRSTVSVRGELSLLPAADRLADGAEALAAAGGEPGAAEEEEGSEPVLLGPPALRVDRNDSVSLCEGTLSYGRLATAFGRSVPTTGVEIDDKFAVSRMSMHVPREVAESLSAQDFAAEVAPYLRRFGRAYLPEVVAATGRSPETCVDALDRLVERGAAARLGPREWRTVDGAGGRGRDT